MGYCSEVKNINSWGGLLLAQVPQGPPVTAATSAVPPRVTCASRTTTLATKAAVRSVSLLRARRARVRARLKFESG